MKFIQVIKQQLQQPLPGRVAHAMMAPTSTRLNYRIPEDARVACVMALFYPKNQTINIVLIERSSSNPKDRHRGQISFPGGKLETIDSSHLAAALREANEEIGVVATDIQVLGALTELYIPVSNFKVFPFVGYLPYAPDFVLQASEVSSILEVPFDDFLNNEVRKTKTIPMGNGFRVPNVPYFDIQGHTIWGATSMILSELIEVAKISQNQTLG